MQCVAAASFCFYSPGRLAQILCCASNTGVIHAGKQVRLDGAVVERPVPAHAVAALEPKIVGEKTQSYRRPVPCRPTQGPHVLEHVGMRAGLNDLRRAVGFVGIGGRQVLCCGGAKALHQVTALEARTGFEHDHLNPAVASAYAHKLPATPEPTITTSASSLLAIKFFQCPSHRATTEQIAERGQKKASASACLGWRSPKTHCSTAVGRDRMNAGARPIHQGVFVRHQHGIRVLAINSGIPVFCDQQCKCPESIVRKAARLKSSRRGSKRLTGSPEQPSKCVRKRGQFRNPAGVSAITLEQPDAICSGSSDLFVRARERARNSAAERSAASLNLSGRRVECSLLPCSLSRALATTTKVIASTLAEACDE